MAIELSAEEQLAEDDKVSAKNAKEQKELRKRKLLWGTKGFNSVTNEEIAAKEKEGKDWDTMKNTQYLLRKKREYKEHR